MGGLQKSFFVKYGCLGTNDVRTVWSWIKHTCDAEYDVEGMPLRNILFWECLLWECLLGGIYVPCTLFMLHTIWIIVGVLGPCCCCVPFVHVTSTVQALLTPFVVNTSHKKYIHLFNVVICHIFLLLNKVVFLPKTDRLLISAPLYGEQMQAKYRYVYKETANFACS